MRTAYCDNLGQVGWVTGEGQGLGGASSRWAMSWPFVDAGRAKEYLV